MTINLGILSKFRTELMGLAAIGIIVCHAPGNNLMMPEVIRRVCILGGYGVDVFLFLSGFGMYYSIDNLGIINKQNLRAWYLKRFVRLMVPYLLISVPYYLLFCLIKGENLINWPYYVSTISFWTEHQGQWFIDALIPLYLLTPPLYLLFRKVDNHWSVLLLVTIVIFILCGLPFHTEQPNSTLWGNVRFVLNRIPSFIWGIWLAPYIKRDVEIRHFELYILASIILFVVLEYFDIWGAPFIMLPLLAFFLVLLHYSTSCIRHLCVFIGNISLESYMFNVTLPFFFIQHMNWKTINFDFGYGNYLPYTVVVILGIVGSKIVNKLSKHIISKVVIR